MYSFDSTVRYSECGSDATLTIGSLLNYFQDCATFHSEHIGHGIPYMDEMGCCWVVTSWQVSIRRMPCFLERIRVSTWCPEMGAAHARRDCSVVNADGEVLVEATSLWVVFDIARGRAIRVPASEQAFATDDAPIDLPPARRKIKVTGEGTKLASFPVTIHHLDTNQHVNNAQYVQMAEDAVRELGLERAYGGLQVQYREPATLGDQICPRVIEEPDACVVSLERADGAPFAVCRLAYA